MSNECVFKEFVFRNLFSAIKLFNLAKFVDISKFDRNPSVKPNLLCGGPGR